MVKFRCDVRIGSGSLTWHQAEEADDVGAVGKLSERDALAQAAARRVQHDHNRAVGGQRGNLAEPAVGLRRAAAGYSSGSGSLTTGG